MSKPSDKLQDGAFHWKPRETSAMYEALVEQIPAVLYVDADDEVSSALYMSPQVEEMLGYTQEEWLDDPDLWVKLLHPKDRERALAEASHARITGETFDTEYRLVSREGREMWVQDKAARVEVGNSVVWQGVLLDVTEHKRTREELRRSEELFKKAFESASISIAHVAPDGRWLRVNDKLCEISGYSREELVGMSYLDLSLPEDLAAVEERLRRLLGGRVGSYSVERRFVRRDGSRVWTDVTVSLVCASTSEPDYLVCVAEDVTARKIQELVPEPLTCREAEVLGKIVAGCQDSQIAIDLKLSLGTVKRDVRYVLAKLGARDRREAASRAINIGLSPPPY